MKGRWPGRWREKLELMDFKKLSHGMTGGGDGGESAEGADCRVRG